MSIWESDQVVSWQEESSGGGGWICRVNVQLGYKVFARGKSNEETFFPADINVDGAMESAKAAARAYVDKLNEELEYGEQKIKAPSNAIWIEIDKETVFGRDTSSWEGNRIFTTPAWTSAYKDVILPAMRESNASTGWQWARVSFKPDPYQPKRMNQHGEEVDNLVAYIAEVYLSKQDALDAAASVATPKAEAQPAQTQTVAKTTEGVPDGYDADTWAEVIEYIKEEITSGKSLKEIADDYGVTVADVARLK